jgi:hypothetical protein
MKLVPLLACLPLLVAACGKSDAEKFADAYCAEIAKCCVQAGTAGNGEVCHFLFSGGSYNATAGNACLAEMKSQVAAGTFCSGGSSSATCNTVFGTGSTGTKKPGDTCDQDSDCAPSTEGTVTCASLYTNGAWIHKCQVRVQGKAGDGPCLGTQDGDVFSSSGTSAATDLPTQGYVCDTADGVECSSGTCVALAAVGQSCSYASDCVRSAYCDRSSRCVGRVVAGGTCTGVDAAECVEGYYCPDASPRQCTAKVATGATCTSDSMCSSGNCDGTTCKPSGLETLGWAIVCS